MKGLADSTYTATDSGWGVWFVLVFLLLGALLTLAVCVVRAVGRWARSQRRHELAPPSARHLRIREVRR